MTAKAPAIQPDAVPASGPQHVLPELPYDYSALEACIEAQLDLGRVAGSVPEP